MPIGFDVSGISLAEGLRAAIASGVVVLASVWWHSFPLLIVAFAANLTCFCDTGGLLRTRVRALLTFTVVGALCWTGFGLLRNLPWPLVVPLAAVAVLLCSMARVWGAAAQAVGNVLIVTVALALDAPLTVHEALVLGASFVVGGIWAVTLTLLIWRIHPTYAATRAVEQVWSSLASLAGDLRRLSTEPVDAAEWDAHARAHRRATRAAIEEARTHVTGAVDARGPASAPVLRSVIRLDAAESVFAALIATSDVLEANGPTVREQGAQALRVLRPLITLCAKGAFDVVDRFEPALARVERIGVAQPALGLFLHAVVDGLRITSRVAGSDKEPNPAPLPFAARPSVFGVALGALRDNLTWDSAILRHATRATVVTVPALAWSLIWPSPYAHWLTITLALTMQPYFSATWQRVLERVGGTLLGGLIGAAIAFMPQTELVMAVLLVPLCVIGFSVRQVSYGAYIACLTPLVVVLFDVAVPGHSDATIAAMRLFYTALGGVVALAACMLLWPSWEPDRLAKEIGNALLAHARLADIIFAACLGTAPRGDAEQARRAAGVANNNLEASLSRSLQEPHRSRNRDLEAGLVIDGAVRRLGGALIAFQHEVAAHGVTDTAAMRHWQQWITGALRSLSLGQRVMQPPPSTPSDSTLARLRRAIDVIDTARGARA